MLLVVSIYFNDGYCIKQEVYRSALVRAGAR